MEYEEAKRRLESHLELHFHLRLKDVEITESRGYWRIKKECDDSCHHPLHGCIGNDERMQHTISFQPHLREKGRIISPYTVWNLMKTTQDTAPVTDA